MRLEAVFLLSIVLATAVQYAAANSTLRQQPANARCANSMFMTGDIFPSKRGGVIKQISKIINSQGQVVGWSFKTTTGGEFAQVDHRMSQRDLAKVGLRLQPADRLSAIFPLTSNPWPDLRIKTCKPSEMQLGKYAPWRPDRI